MSGGLQTPLVNHGSIAGFVLSFALTYVTHAAAWAGAAALCWRSSALSYAARHNCWKAALFGPLLSAALATGWPDADATSGGGAVVHQTADAARDPGAASRARAWPGPLELSVRSRTSNSRRVAWLVLAASGVGLLRFGGAAALLRRRLRRRTVCTDLRLVRRFGDLCARLRLRHVRITECEQLTSPCIIGTSEVCVPPALLSGLSDADLDAVLAHELAHVERGDGVWFPLIGAVELTLWLQPFNHIVSSYARRSAEMSCDDRAVELTQNAFGLARAIVRIAEQAARPVAPALTPSMVSQESELLSRVRRLASQSRPYDGPRCAKPSALAQVCALGALASVVLVTLCVRVVCARPVAAFTAQASALNSKQPSAEDAIIWAEQNARMVELAATEQRVIAELAALSARPEADHEGSPESVRILELEQELRHVRAMEAWIEQSVVEQSSTTSVAKGSTEASKL